MKMEQLKPCPFCGGENIKMMHKDIGFIGWNGFGAKKIKYQSYAMCNKCYSKGAPATCEYEVDTERGRAVLEENDQKAATAWNRRAEDTEAKRRRTEQNPKPLTLDELIRMDGEPVWIEDKQDGGQWGLVDLNHKTLVWYEPPVQAMVLKDGNFYILREYEAYGENLQAYRTKPEGR